MTSPLLLADTLHVSLSGRPILSDLSFAVEAGTWVGLLGPNGSGKTTLLRTLSGTVPYRGRLLLEDRPIRQWRPRALARRMAFVRQSPVLAFDFSVEELVLLGRAPHKNWLQGFSREDREQARRALRDVDLEGFEDRSVLTLSGGEVQRVFLAQALVQGADLLLLDEPTAHLDVHHQFEFMNRVQGLVRGGRTVIAVFHDLELAARYADRLLVLREGRLVRSGPPEEVLTPELIASVFRMGAAVEATPEGTLRVSYHAPLGSPDRRTAGGPPRQKST